MRGTSNGQPVTQYPQPMQFSSWKSTIPLEYCTIAPGEGQALRQPGSAQCMQPSLRISHSRSPFGFSYSAKRIRVQERSLRSAGFWYPPTLVPISSRRSFHSMHATWQALQPMHLVVSMSLATLPVYDCRTLGSGMVVAERRTMSRDCRAIVLPLDLLDLDQEGLELRRLRVAIADKRRQRVGKVPRLREPLEAPVDRNADVVQRLAVHLHRAQALGHHRYRLDMPAVGGHLHLIPGGDSQLLRERIADLDKLLGLDDRIQPHVLGPVVEVLGEAVGGGRVREVGGLAEGLAILGEDAGSRIVQCARLFRAQRIGSERRLEGLVVLGEGSLGKLLAAEKARHSFRVHDERSHAVRGIFIGLEVRDICAAPATAIPGNELAVGVVGLTVRIAGGAVIQDAPIRWPGESPVEGLAETAGISVVAARHEIAGRSPGPAEDPAAARGAAIVMELGEAGELLAGLARDLGRVLRIG